MLLKSAALLCWCASAKDFVADSCAQAAGLGDNCWTEVELSDVKLIEGIINFKSLLMRCTSKCSSVYVLLPKVSAALVCVSIRQGDDAAASDAAISVHPI